MEKIFISYSRKDIDFARKLAGDLEKAGYDVWWDITGLHGGDDWVSTIPAAIAASRYMIVVLTPNSIESIWVRKEYTHALNLRKKIVPIMFTSTSVPFALNTLNYVNFMSGDYEDNFKNLLAPLGFTGKPPMVKPFNQTRVMLLSVFRKYAILIVIILMLLLAFAWNTFSVPSQSSPTPTYTATFSTTPTTISSRETATSTPEMSPPTASPTYTPTQPTPTMTPTLPPVSLPICLYYYNITGDVSREHPNNNLGSQYAEIKNLKRDGTFCPFFSAYIKNDDDEIWYQFASDDQKKEFEQHEGRWIFGHPLIEESINLKILPLCIYSRSVGTVNVFEEPNEFSGIKGEPLKAGGANCPFFSIGEKKESDGKVWYQFAIDQKVTDFGVYVGGWISGEYLTLPELFLSTSTARKLPEFIPTPASPITETSAP